MLQRLFFVLTPLDERRRVASVVAGLVLLVGCASAGRAVLYSSYETGPYRPTDFWCGNRSRGGLSNPCTGRATNEAGEVPSRKVEVRGWILDDPHYSEVENEFIFNLRLDAGWTPASPASEQADPINTIEKINAALTPHNVVAFGRGPAGETTAWLGDGAWAGPNGLVLHVEINGWGRRRGTDDRRARQWPPPDGWSLSPETPAEPASNGDAATPGVAWAFDPWNPPAVRGREGPLALGDYVRLVGLLWEDDPHEDSDEDRPGVDGDRTVEGKRCWHSGRHKRGRNGRGFAELHPVDYVAKLDPPTRADALYVITLCGESSIDLEMSPPAPRPGAARAAFEEFIDAEFTSLGSVTRQRVTAGDDRVRADIAVRPRSGGSAEPKFKAIYRVYWKE